jgi:ATP-binding cassette subfamily B (MDR/TAP) protein 1
VYALGIIVSGLVPTKLSDSLLFNSKHFAVPRSGCNLNWAQMPSYLPPPDLMPRHVSSENLAYNNSTSSPIEPLESKGFAMPLCSFLSCRKTLYILIPAILASLIAGGIAPFMTLVVGKTFSIFSRFSLAINPSQEDKDHLIHGVSIAAIELVALAAGTLAFGSITSSLWILTGETNVKALRKCIYEAVVKNDMAWFDKMGVENTKYDKGDPVGVGGMMAKFSKSALSLSLRSLRITLYCGLMQRNG